MNGLGGVFSMFFSVLAAIRSVSAGLRSSVASSCLGVFAMATWNVPRFDRGDEDQDETLRGVGLVMSSWEGVELELAILYSCFVGDPKGRSVMQYGSGRIFRDRIDGLNRAASRYFISNCNQDAEGALSYIVDEAISASDRRNDVAHGIVFRVDLMTHFRHQIPVSLLNREHYAVIPPIYSVRKHAGGLPNYAYRSRDMIEIAQQLYTLRRHVVAFENRLFGLESD